MAALVAPTLPEEEVKSKPLLLETMGEGGQLNGGVPTLEVNDSKIPTLEVNDSTIPTLEVNKNQSTETSGNEGVFESSTTVLLRRPTAESEGGRRVPSFHLASRTDFTLSDTFRVSGKLCVVTLEEDHISWVPKKTTGKKEAPKEVLYLCDVFAVVPGNSPKHSRASNSDSEPTEFTLHALKSNPGSPGQLSKVTFRCPSKETYQIWSQQIHHQMQNFGNRPRKLHVVVNLFSGDSPGAVERTWTKVERLFQLAQIHTDITYTQTRFHARDHVQMLDLSQYDGIIAVGGDGVFNEILNGLLMQTQQQSGVNTRRSRFVPVTPTVRLGIIPAGCTNSIARSVLGCKCPMVAAAQIMLGCSTPLDVCSVSQNGQLILFSAGPMTYGFWSDTAAFSHDYAWLPRRVDLATIKTLLTLRHFEAEITFLPMEDPEVVLQNRERCFSRCLKCSNFECNLESPSATNEKGASVMASYSEVDRVDEDQWKTISGQFCSVMVCPHACCSQQAPIGASPYAHVGNGCADLVMLDKCSKMGFAKWLLRQRKGAVSQFDLPYVQIQRVKEFRFREILRPFGSSANEEAQGSVDNLVQEVDDDEVTNSQAGERAQQRGEGAGVGMPTSRWTIDGEELLRSDIDVRVHRHLISIFARGVEPLGPESSSSSNTEMGAGDRTEQEDLLPES